MQVIFRSLLILQQLARDEAQNIQFCFYSRRAANNHVPYNWADLARCPRPAMVTQRAASPGYRAVSLGSWAGRWLPASR
jgi:hypothetical protein